MTFARVFYYEGRRYDIDGQACSACGVIIEPEDGADLDLKTGAVIHTTCLTQNARKPPP